MLEESKFFSLNENDLDGKRVFISEAFDSTLEGLVWSRAALLLSSDGTVLSFRASDSYLPEPAAWGKKYNNPKDVLLHEYRGRYLWVKIEFYGDIPETFRLRLYYPAHTFTRYLPEIYQSGMDSFLVRFTALYQDIYLDMEEKIAEIPQLLEPRTADRARLELLSEWLSCDEFKILPENKRGEFLVKCTHFYKGFGTRAGIEEFFEWFCGEKPLILEYFQFEKYARQKWIKRLYGDNQYLFTVIFRRYKDMRIANLMLGKMKPAHTECRAVALADECKLDSYTYLGINSYI